MLKKQTVIVLFLLFCSIGVCYAGWQQIASYPPDFNFRAVTAYYKIGGSIYGSYFAVGDNGKIVYGEGNSSGEVNTGITGISDYNLMDVVISKSNGQNVYIVGEKKADPNKGQGIIIKSPDGGNTWIQVITGLPLPANTPFKSVSVSNDGVIVYISGGNGVMIKSINSGSTWQRMYAPKLSGLTNATDADFSCWRKIDCDPTIPTDVWTINEDFGVAAHSIDGGANWASVAKLPTDQSYNFLEETHIYNSNYPPQMPDLFLHRSGNELIVGNSNGKYSTTTNGVDWTTIKTNQPNEAWFYCAGSHYPSAIEYIGGSGGNIIGLGGMASYFKAGALFKDMDFEPSGYSGYAVSSNGGIFGDLNDLGVAIEMSSCWITESGSNLYINWSINMPDPQNALGNVYIYRSFNGGPMRYLTNVPANYYSTIAAGEIYKGTYRTYVSSDYYGAVYSGGYTKTTGEESPVVFSPTTLTIENLYEDQGGTINIVWTNEVPPTEGPGTELVIVGKSDKPDGPFWPLGTINTSGNGMFMDGNATLGHTFYYCLQSLENSYDDARASTIVLAANGSSIDKIRPDKYVTNTNYTGTYDATNHILHLKWDPSTDPNLAGYWICPVIGDDEFKFDLPTYYHLSHTTPIDRTSFEWQVPDYAWQNNWTLLFAVTAMDYSGNIGNWSDYLTLNTKAVTNSNAAAATAYNNGRHLLYDSDSKLHLTYTSGDSVFYQNSINDGYTWSGTGATGPGLYSDGTNPSSVIGIYGSDITIAWKAETAMTGWVLKSAKHTGQTFSNVETILEMPGGYDQLHFAGPPAMAVNAAGTHLVLEKEDRYCNSTGYAWYWKLLYGFRPAGSTAFSWTVLDSLQGSEGGGGGGTTSPTICTDSKGGIQVVWDYQGEIYWRVYDPYIKGWRGKINLSNSPDVVSAEPSLSFYGDVHIVWQEGNDIMHRRGNWGVSPAKSKVLPSIGFWWDTPENVSNTPGASLNPVFDGNYIAWSEADELNPEQYYAYFSNYSNFVWNTSTNYSKNPTQPSVYPQIAYRQNADGNKMTTIWTEGTGPLYSLIARDTAGQVTAALAADLGGIEPSIYTIERDGYLTYTQTKSKTTGITVDYDSTALEYYLPSLDREQKQTVKINLYQEYADKADYIYQIWVDNASLDTVKVPSGKMVTFVKDLPKSVSHDGEGVLKIINLKKGAIVTCDKYELFAYDKATGRKNDNGGAQSEMSEAKPVAYRYELMQNAPNPCSKQTAINYQLAKQGQVSLKVYNTLGQVVKTLVNGTQNPGPYSVKWNGKDEAGRQAAAGIYFYRLNAGEFNSTKKMVVLR